MYVYVCDVQMVGEQKELLGSLRSDDGNVNDNATNQ